MALYFTEHRHTAETCPTKNREMMMMLGQHVSQENADKFGIRILSDIVHPGEHWMNMVLEADDRSKVEEFMQPFGIVGTVNIKEVRTCEEVVASATC